MCSNHDDGDLEPVRASLSTLELDENGMILNRRSCMKCKSADANVVIRVNDPFCRDCFLQYCTHKFRSAFGKSKLIRDGERVLVAFSGGAASSAMQHLIQEGRSVRAQKKLRFTPCFLFIDELSILVRDEEAVMFRDQIETQLRNSGYDYNIVKLEQLFDQTETSKSTPDATPTEKLKRFVNSASSLSAQEYLVKTLRYDLIAQFAKSGNFSKVIVGDTASRLSVNILSCMAQGKGAHIAYDTSFADDRYDDLLIIRPMRDFTSKEVAMYNTFYSLSPVTIPLLSTKSKMNSSINRLTEEFVGGLQADFPSTVNTIMRTGDKLMNSVSSLPALTKTSSTQTCVFCKAPLDTDVPISSALNSIRFSDTVSQLRQQELEIAESTKPDTEERIRKRQVVEQTCYGCRQITKALDGDSMAELPSAVSAALQRRSEMRTAVESYLLT